ncbi:WD40 repeat-like protein [Daedalea quercina L-15889]|uniref:WD40 repeat-like protein n=1 Tax=Daedalea quercina L-15889 TaxID=1314783 RepID=A0A165QRF6_9APHY|nr:WD40 repeat-like protein [Daedalea quercina L-15889]
MRTGSEASVAITADVTSDRRVWLQAMSRELFSHITAVREQEELVFSMLASMPRASVAALQCRMASLLQFDVLGMLPDEIALHVLFFLPPEALFTCSLVSRRWRTLADDQLLWKGLCAERDWQWRTPTSPPDPESSPEYPTHESDDDEGMGDEEEDTVQSMLLDDSGYNSMDMDALFPASSSSTAQPTSSVSAGPSSPTFSTRTSGPSSPTPRLSFSRSPRSASTPDYKLLYQTHLRIRHRIKHRSYKLHNLQTPGNARNHTNAIYCLQLYTYPDTGVQVLFTGSKDRSVREWNLATGEVTRVIEGIHSSSILSICVNDGLLASGGSDHRVAIWDLDNNKPVKVIDDHMDSVLCVRFDDKKLVTCSKDRTVRVYSLPTFAPKHVLLQHRAAVNAVAISPIHIVSASGDRSVRLWDAETGALLKTFENHHWRGIAAIDFKFPFVLTGSSDKHLRMLDLRNSTGWSTAPPYRTAPAASGSVVCQMCGNNPHLAGTRPPNREHEELVRSVALSHELSVSGSYDFTVKVWDRETGALMADLVGGHTGRIFCVGFDATKVISCGEDQKICIWDFAHGMDTSFVSL